MEEKKVTKGKSGASRFFRVFFSRGYTTKL